MILDDYITAAVNYGVRIVDGDSRAADCAFKKVEACFNRMKENEKNWRKFLLGLLDHENESVRLWASSHLLNYHPKKAVASLKDLISSDSLIGMVAEISLDRWNKGELQY